jgi:hypothetical protein
VLSYMSWCIYILFVFLAFGTQVQGMSLKLLPEIETGSVILSSGASDLQYILVEESDDLMSWDTTRLMKLIPSRHLQSIDFQGDKRFYRAKAASAITGLLVGNVWHADGDIAASGDGLSWAGAFSSLQEAFNAADEGDVILSRGTFFESVVINGLDRFAWIGDSDPERRTILRGDTIIEELFVDDASSVGGVYLDSEFKPRSVTWNYQRDDALGHVTGIKELRPYYGHLMEAANVAEVQNEPAKWFWQDGIVYMSPPAGQTYDSAQVTVCLPDRDAIEVINSDSFLISGLDVLLWMGYSNNTGYCVQGIACRNAVFNDINCWDYGWHALGFSGVTSYNCEISNCNAYSASEVGGLVQAPYVFYANSYAPDLGHRLLDSSFYVYPPLTASGKALCREMKPKMLLVHGNSSQGHRVGGVVMRDCYMKSLLNVVRLADESLVVGDSLQGTSVVSLDDSIEYNKDLPWDYPLQVIDCVFEREMPVPGNHVAFWRCRFDGAGYQDTRGFTSQHNQLITYCVSSEFIYPKYSFGAHQYIRQHKTNPGVFSLSFEQCIFAISGNNGKESALFGIFKPSDVSIRVSNSILYSPESALLIRCYTNSTTLFSSADLDFSGNWYDLHGSKAFRTSSEIGYDSRWMSEFDVIEDGALYQSASSFNSPENGDFSYNLGSTLDLLSVPHSNFSEEYLKGINHVPYSGKYGASQ